MLEPGALELPASPKRGYGGQEGFPDAPSGPEVELEGENHHPSFPFPQMRDLEAHENSNDGHASATAWGAEASRNSWGEICCTIHRPLKTYWNMFPTILLLAYIATTALYIYTRATRTIPTGDVPLKIYSWFVLGVECMGVTSMLPYCLLLTLSQKPKKTAKGLPAVGSIATDDYYRFVLRVLVPCYKEDDQVIADTVNGVLRADLPPGAMRFVYLCDDGGEESKKEFISTLGPEAVYVTGRRKIKGDINGKSSNLNNCLRNVIYDKYKMLVDGQEVVQWDHIPLSELVVIFDADMVPEKDFFLRICEVMTNPDYALCLSPQSFHNVAPETDLFNNLNLQFWEYWLPGAVAWGYIACTGTNFCIRASPLAHCNFFPTYTITEDYALGMELKKKGYRGSYLLQYIAKGEAPTEVRNVMRQRSRWCKGHMQVFFSWAASPLTQWRLSLPMKLWYSYGTWTYIVNIITTPTFLLIPFISLAFGINCVILNKSFAQSATAYYACIFLIQNYVNKVSHIRSMWFASISNVVLWFTYTKAVVNVLLSVADLKGGVGFKVTQKAVVPGSGSNPVKAVARAVSSVVRNMSSRFHARRHGYERSMSELSHPYSGAGDYSGELEGGHVHVSRPPNQRNQPVQVKVVVNSGPKQDVSPLLEKKEEAPKLPWRQRFKAVFSAQNVGNLGGVLDPVALAIMLVFSLSVIGLGIWRLVMEPASATVGVPRGLPSPYLTVPMLWAIGNLIPPYLFIHYCFTSGGSFKLTAGLCRLIGNAAVLMAVGLLWFSLPLKLDTAAALTKSAQFTRSQAKLAAGVKDMATVAGVQRDMSGGVFIGGDPVKYVMPLASAVTMLSWSMIDFPNGYKGTVKQDTMETIKQGATYLMRSYIDDPASSKFIAQVGDPTPYILTPVQQDAAGRVWAPVSQDPNFANPRPAFVLDRQNLGVDLLGSSAAALAAAHMVLKQNGGDQAMAAQMLQTAQLVYRLARSNETAMKSYCDTGVPCVVNATWEDNVPPLVLNPEQVSQKGIFCWVADETEKTCYWKKTADECKSASRVKKIFTARDTCCSYLYSKGVYNGSLTAQGSCALPENQTTCWVPEPIRRTCLKQEIDAATGLGCTGAGVQFFATSFECCNYLKQHDQITFEKPGSGTCSANLTSCFVQDLVNRTCTLKHGNECSIFGLETLYDEALPCCNSLISKGTGNVTGICKGPPVTVSLQPPSPPILASPPPKGGRRLHSLHASTADGGTERRRRLLQSSDLDNPAALSPFLMSDINNPNERTLFRKPIQGDFQFYKSHSIYDDMAWGASWLYRASLALGNLSADEYLGDVERFLNMHDELEAGPSLLANETYYSFDWDNTVWGVAAIMAKMTDAETYHDRLRTFLKAWTRFKAPKRPAELERELMSQGKAFNARLLGLEEIEHDATKNRDLLLLDHCIPDRNTTKAARMQSARLASDNTTNIGIQFFDPLAVLYEADCSDGRDNDCDGLIDGDDPDCPLRPARKTNFGLAWSRGPSLAHAAGASFLSSYYASYAFNSKVRPISTGEKLKLRCSGQAQMSYILGRNEKQISYIVGNGKFSPSRIPHRDSSCAKKDVKCDFRNSFFPNRPNPQMDLVKGALVYGPNLKDVFSDDRQKLDTQIALDFNAHFNALAAALLHMHTDEDACGQYNGALTNILHSEF